MLWSEPKGISQACLETWKRLGPLSVRDYAHQQKLYTGYDYHIGRDSRYNEWINKRKKHWHCFGIVNQKGKADGIVRIIDTEAREFSELQYANNKYFGLRRKIFADGSYVKEFYLLGDKHGRFVKANASGKVSNRHHWAIGAAKPIEGIKQWIDNRDKELLAHPKSLMNWSYSANWILNDQNSAGFINI